MKTLSIFLVVAVVAAGLEGCSDSGGTKAPPITGKPFKKWKDMTQDEKIAALEKSPDPSKAAHIAAVKAGKM